VAATATLLPRLAAFQPCEVNKLKAAPVRDAAVARDVAAQTHQKALRKELVVRALRRTRPQRRRPPLPTTTRAPNITTM